MTTNRKRAIEALATAEYRLRMVREGPMIHSVENNAITLAGAEDQVRMALTLLGVAGTPPPFATDADFATARSQYETSLGATS